MFDTSFRRKNNRISVRYDFRSDAVIVITHHRFMDARLTPRSRATGFTLIELLVVIAIIGLLVGLLLPAVQSSREAARALQCQNNLHQISLAAAAHHDVRGYFPVGRLAPRPGDPPAVSCGGQEPSWFVQILPYLEQQTLHDQWNEFQSFASHSTQTRSTVVATFLCPTRRTLTDAVSATSTTSTGGSSGGTLPCGCPTLPTAGSSITSYGGAHGDYAGNHGDPSPGMSGVATDFYFGGNGNGVIISSRPVCQAGQPTNWLDRITAADITDGLSVTILAGESHVLMGRLRTFPDDPSLFDGSNFQSSTRVGGPGAPLARHANDATATYLSFGSWHPQRCQFTFADGSVRSIHVTVSSTVLAQWTNRGDGEVTSTNF